MQFLSKVLAIFFFEFCGILSPLTIEQWGCCGVHRVPFVDSSWVDHAVSSSVCCYLFAIFVVARWMRQASWGCFNSRRKESWRHSWIFLLFWFGIGKGFLLFVKASHRGGRNFGLVLVPIRFFRFLLHISLIFLDISSNYRIFLIQYVVIVS